MALPHQHSSFNKRLKHSNLHADLMALEKPVKG